MKTRILRQLPLIVATLASVGLLAAVLWQRSPALAIALAGPLVALVLYERSIRRGRAAMRLALLDPLTGLGNQRAFAERLDEELSRAVGEQAALALCLLDVDHFKRVNDEEGHPSGDRVLVAVAGCLRRDGEAFRLGGDEFALVLPGRDLREAADVAAAVVARMRTLPTTKAMRVTVSAGVAAFPVDGTTRDEVVESADTRLYRAKTHGGNRVEPGNETLAAVCNGLS